MEIEMKCPECDMPRLHHMLMGKMHCLWCKGWFTYEEIVDYNTSKQSIIGEKDES